MPAAQEWTDMEAKPGCEPGQEGESCALHRTGSAHVCWIDLRLSCDQIVGVGVGWD